MKKILFTILGVMIVFVSYSQINQSKTQVLTLGVFHFAYRNLDVHQTEETDQIDIISKSSQDEIRKIVDALKTFQPTKIAVEVSPSDQITLDSLYRSYRNGNHELTVDEVQQLGFRLADQMDHEKLYCTNDWGKHYESLSFIFNGNSPRTKALAKRIQNNPDSIYFPEVNKVYGNIIDQLLDYNDPEHLSKRLGAYLTGVFKYEEKEGDFIGVDFETGRWFNRNLRIFRNIQRIPIDSNDRILVIYGKDHMNLLNVFFESSPEYEWVNPIPYLEKAKNEITAK